MKNRFTSFFLIFFLIDSVLTVLQSGLYLSGINLFDATIPKTVRGILSFAVLPLAIIQIIVFFKHKLKLSALVLGVYPLAVALISTAVGIYLFMGGKIAVNASEYLHALHFYMLFGGVIQLLLGVWAARDLSEGHGRSGTS